MDINTKEALGKIYRV